VSRALADPSLQRALSVPLHVIAAGKAASSMATAFAAEDRIAVKSFFATGTHRVPAMPPGIEWQESSHPVPDARSVAAAERALQIARSVEHDECLVLLLSGGASAVMALPADGLTLADKQQTIRTMLLAGADIEALNTVRKHLSAIKGGRLAAACRGRVLTLAVSDVVGHDLSIIGSGPCVADPSTWDDAWRALDAFGGTHHLPAIRDYVRRGCRGEIEETPKDGSSATARTAIRIIATQWDALEGAHAVASAMGYRVLQDEDPLTGEAREAAARWFDGASSILDHVPTRLCVLSAGETTVTVTGSGRGGRNQEFALALIDRMAGLASRDVIAASIGTDGIDGPTDAAGAIVDRGSAERARSLGMEPQHFLDANNSYELFDRLGDLIRLGRTDTNVGDIQVLLAN
jgi:glycerate 2-kinase